MRRVNMMMMVFLLVFLIGCTQSNIKNEAARSENPQQNVEKEQQADEAENVSEDTNEEITDDADEDVTEDEGDEVEEAEIEEDPVAYYINKSYFIKPVEETETNEKIALITIDDAPYNDNDSTMLLLDTLDKYNAKAIWFVNGQFVDKYPDLLVEIHSRGHIVGNHTWSHHKMKELDEEKTRKEILSVNEIVEELIGERPVYYRAPNGVNTSHSKKVMEEEGMQAMNWTYGMDWELNTPEAIEEHYINNLHNGANLLFHDKEKTAKAMDAILKKMTEEGYKFVLPTEVHVN